MQDLAITANTGSNLYILFLQPVSNLTNVYALVITYKMCLVRILYISCTDGHPSSPPNDVKQLKKVEKDQNANNNSIYGILAVRWLGITWLGHKQFCVLKVIFFYAISQSCLTLPTVLRKRLNKIPTALLLQEFPWYNQTSPFINVPYNIQLYLNEYKFGDLLFELI